MIESAFQKDAEKRQQQDAQAVLAKSIGIQDEEGNQLHGRARTEQARNLREEMKAATRAPEKPPANRLEAPRAGDIRVAINAPHKAVVRGNQIALTIQQDAAGVAGAAAQTLITPHHAFRVRTRPTPGSNPVTYQRIVEADSKVLTAISPRVEVAVTGLAEDDEPDTDDSGWETFTGGDLIWLERTYTLGVAGSPTIKSLGAGDTWPNFDSEPKCLVEWSGDGSGIDPFVQTKSRAVIARAFTDDAGVPRPIQVLHSDLLSQQWDVDGKIMDVLAPYTAP